MFKYAVNKLMSFGTAPLPRRVTRGPLDDYDPLSSSGPPIASRIEPGNPVLLRKPPNPLAPSTLPPHPSPSSSSIQELGQPLSQEKDLSFLLDPSIYHPLSQLDIPLPLRQQLPPPPSTGTPLQESLIQLDNLMSKGYFLSVASLAASILVSGSVSASDSETVFELLAMRYSCLELTGNSLLAAQESKALGDLNSAFYYVDPPPRSGNIEVDTTEQLLQNHIIPFPLRLQALRLQAIGFSDPRRGISALYDLGLECREHAASSLATPEERETWSGRLSQIGMKVVNALIEMGDLNCASRTLSLVKPSDSNSDSMWKTRMVLLYLKIGDLSGAQKLMQGLDVTDGTDGRMNLLGPLLTFAEGRYGDAVLAWEKSLESDLSKEQAALIKQNLAVAYLYSGHIQKTRDIMEGLINEGYSFQSLVLNLTTLYELSSDKSRELKLGLADRVAVQDATAERGWTRTNADFKL